MCVRLCTCTHVCARVCFCVCLCACVRVFVCICVWLCVRVQSVPLEVHQGELRALQQELGFNSETPCFQWQRLIPGNTL